jgi:FixJ family two-component response regulator
MPTEAEKLACVERELKYRERVYARLVENGKMTERLRDRELNLMSAIVEDYKARVIAEQLF